MRTIALRFSDNYAPPQGTIKLHKAVIDEHGYVWYGKFGSAISPKIVNDLLKMEQPKFLLIHGGTSLRYWVLFDSIERICPEPELVPEYYRNQMDSIKAWFRVKDFIVAPKNIMSKCIVSSSKSVLTDASMHSLSPYFIIDYEE